MNLAGLYGLSRTNHDLNQARGWGKNTFTNTFPVAVGQYLHGKLGLDPVQLEAFVRADNTLGTQQVLRSWADVIGTDPESAQFDFEVPFEAYAEITARNGQAKKSDVVVKDAAGNQTRALEIKLTAVPDSASAARLHEDQSAEIVCRPPTIEQLAYSICMSYGTNDAGRIAINNIIIKHVNLPQQLNWADEHVMRGKLPLINAIVEDIIRDGLGKQLPAVLNVVWRTEGKRPVLEDDCFEVFSWTNFGFLMLFLDSSRQTLTGRSREISRPQRSLIWLVKMLYDYSTQRFLESGDTFRTITFGSQTDKGGAFNGQVTSRYLKGRYLDKPRVPNAAVDEIVLDGGSAFLAPERRLDAAIYIEMIREGVLTPESPAATAGE